MSPFRSRQIILVLVAFAVAAGSFQVPGSALADTALFRVERHFHNAPLPPVTTPGGAGKYENYIEPYTFFWQGMTYPPATAIVEPGNPIGGAFTLPPSFIDFSGTYTITPKTGWLGYTTVGKYVYANGPGRFRPNNGATGPTRVVFPTTLGNPYPNYGDGNPVTPTTTFDGRYDFYRYGSINITPGPRRFGGTFRMFYKPEADYYQFIYYFSPAVYKAYGDFYCFVNGVPCTPDSSANIGDVTQYYGFTRFLLNVKGTGTGPQLQDNTAKATTSIGMAGGYPTPDGEARFITAMQRYLNTTAPWTTGFASVHNPIGSGIGAVITPQGQGYDTSLGGADITVTHSNIDAKWSEPLSTIVYTTGTYKQYLTSVKRVVSMVRPKLNHTYLTPLDPTTDPITSNWTAARLHTLKVFFLPEPTGMLLLGAGIGALLVLNRMRRR